METQSNLITKAQAAIDDRLNLNDTDEVILVIEDDISFASTLMSMLHDFGQKVIITNSNDNVFTLLEKYPIKGIILDTDISMVDGWALFDQLKHKFISRHLPIYIISSEAKRRRVLSYGAIGIEQKPLKVEQINSLIQKLKATIELNTTNILFLAHSEEYEELREFFNCLNSELIFNDNIEYLLNDLTNKAVNILVITKQLDIKVLNTLLEQIYKFEKIDKLPILISTFKENPVYPSETELEEIAAKYNDKLILKLARSKEYLLDLTALFLHKAESSLPQSNRQMLEESKKADPILKDKTVLIVDDDIRNIYAITAILEKYHMNVLSAENGYSGIEILNAHDNIDIVLMDIMMPELDGYKTMAKIREIDKFKDLPIIALTAKAMKGDKEKCLEAGASDYIAKPVDIELLLSLLRVWLYNKIPSIT